MSKNMWIDQQFRWISLVLLACLCLTGIWLKKEEASKSLQSWAAEQVQSQIEDKSCSILTSNQKSLPPIYIIRPLTLKQDTVLLKCKKLFAQVIHFSALTQPFKVAHLFHYQEPHVSYQFSRLNVLSSQSHPPTFA
jgi:hypothetical protein